MNTALQIAVVICSVVSFCALTSYFIHTSPPYTPPQGERAVRFLSAISKWPAYHWIHAILFVLSAHLQRFIPNDTIQKLTTKLKSAGTPLGLTATEFLALALLCGILGGSMGAVMSHFFSKQPFIGFFLGLLLGAALPFSKLENASTRRKQLLTHSLPNAIDLIALCMNAGQHFQGALVTVSKQMPPNHPLRFEFEYMCAKLALGASRKEALLLMAARINTPEINRFVQGVLRAEQKGSSLANIFSVQGKLMRTQRTQLAEQAASRAAVLMLGPLMLIFLSVFLLLLGPFGVKAYYGNLL